MLNYQASILSTALKTFSILLLFAFTSNSVLAQSCDCIDPDSCSPCEGGLKEIEFEYSGGTLGVFYSVQDGNGLVANGIMPSNGIFTINKNSAFAGGYIEVTLFFAGLPFDSENIITSCIQNVFIGRQYGDLTLVSAESLLGGPICCAPEDTDQIPPSFENFPPDTTLTIQANCSVSYNWIVPTAVDGCGFAALQPPVPGNNRTFTLGTETISYSAIDLSGNTFTRSFTVTVIDETPPTITGTLNDIQLFADNNCRAVANWNVPSAADNCGEVVFLATHTPNSVFDVGTTTVTYTATDDSGNSTERSFDVIVSDNIAPKFSSFPEDLVVSANANCEAQVNWDVPQVVDNCSNTIESIATMAPGSTFPLDTTIVTYTAIDERGNETTESFNIVVVDDSAPVFTSFPSDISISAGSSCGAEASWSTPQAVDNCRGSVTPILQEGTPISGSVFPIGTTTINYSAADERGNEIMQSFEITVTDDTAPVFSGCPADILLPASNNCNVIAEWVPPTATDNCELASLSSNYSPNQEFPIGTTEVVYTALDTKGNVSTCGFNVIVSNDFATEIEQACPADVALELFDPAGISYDWKAPQANLQCASIELRSNYAPGDLFPLGETRVRYFYILNDDEVEVCSFTIHVKLAEVVFNIPQIVSPNGDQNNDKWVIENIEKFPQNSVTIVDRWGGEIYKANSYNNEEIVWDGSNKNGDLVPTGTYFYVISVNFESELVEKSGFIELIR